MATCGEHKTLFVVCTYLLNFRRLEDANDQKIWNCFKSTYQMKNTNFQSMKNSEKKISHVELTSTPKSKSRLTPSEFPFKAAHSNAPPPFPFNFANKHFITDQFLFF